MVEDWAQPEVRILGCFYVVSDLRNVRGIVPRFGGRFCVLLFGLQIRMDKGLKQVQHDNEGVDCQLLIIHCSLPITVSSKTCASAPKLSISDFSLHNRQPCHRCA